MAKVFVFIYAKGKEIKALNIEESERLNDELLKDNWKHTQTLDACVFIQYLHNSCEDLHYEIRSLSESDS